MNKKQKIDYRYKNDSIRRLMYWMYLDDKSCADAIQDIGYSHGNTQFADDICVALDCIERVLTLRDDIQNICKI